MPKKLNLSRSFVLRTRRNHSWVTSKCSTSHQRPSSPSVASAVTLTVSPLCLIRPFTSLSLRCMSSCKYPSILTVHLPTDIVTLFNSSLSTNISTTSTLQSSTSTSTSTSQSSDCLLPIHQPPLPIRIALVSTTTALATPSFPALGFLYLVLRITLPDKQLRKTMEGQWGALLSLTTWTFLPTLYHATVASLIVPCAIGNAIVAGGIYGLVDVASGGPHGNSHQLSTFLKRPWIMGSGIGATVGYVAPHHVYGPLMEHVYGMEGMSHSLSYVLNLPFATEVSVVTGAISGMILHPLLYYPIHGIPGWHWATFSGITLAVVSSAVYYVYYGRNDSGLPLPAGSFITPWELELVESIPRYNTRSGTIEAYSLRSARFIGSQEKCVEGKRIWENVAAYIESGKVVFDDKLLAFLYNFWDITTPSKHPSHVVTIKSRLDVQRKQHSMALTDASVAYILNNKSEPTDSKSSIGDQNIANLLCLLNALYDESNVKWKLLSSYKKSLVEVCEAVELLMSYKLQAHSKNDLSMDESSLLHNVETFIRKRCPELRLFTSEEEFLGESIESQLRAAGWAGRELPSLLSKWEQICRAESTRKSYIVLAVVSVMLSAAGAMMLSR